MESRPGGVVGCAVDNSGDLKRNAGGVAFRHAPGGVFGDLRGGHHTTCISVSRASLIPSLSLIDTPSC